MSEIRPEVSKHNPYWIDRHRYYELKHFCLQYPQWVRAYRDTDSLPKKSLSEVIFCGTNEIHDPVRECVETREIFEERISEVENAAKEASAELWTYILKAVTEELSYENLRMVHGLPCGREMWYELYRKFFYILDRSRK